MICYDLKTVIMEYVHDDCQIKRILEWSKACQWNRSNLSKSIKYKNWMEDDIGFKADKFDDVQYIHHQYVNQIKLPLLHQLVQRYKYDFYEFSNINNFLNYLLHKIYELNERNMIGRPKYIPIINNALVNFFPDGVLDSLGENFKPYVKLDTMILNQTPLHEVRSVWESNVQIKFKAYNVNNYCTKIEMYEVNSTYYTFRIYINHIKQDDYNVLVTSLEKMIETQFN
jgi:hypothetical protein